jgi:hypothetical protein
MIESLLPLLGKSIEDKEIKDLLTEWNVVYPKSIYCTPNNSNLKEKIEKHCIRLYFGLGGNSRYLKPIPTARANSYIAQFTMIEFTPKRTDSIPLGVRFDMTPDALTAILGAPKVVDFLGKTTTWRKNYTDKHELIVSDSLFADGKSLRSMTLTFIYESDLNSIEEYEKAGF